MKLINNPSAEETPVASQPWVAPTLWPKPRISQLGPRETYETKSAQGFSIFFGALMIASAVGATFIYQRDIRDHESLLNHGRPLSGVVTEIRKDEDSRTARITYQFGGETYSKRKSISRDIERQYPEGSTIPLVIAQDNPQLFRLIDFTRSDAERERRRDLVGGSILFLAFGAVLLGIRLSLRSYKSIMRDWPVAAALVTESKVTTDGEGSKAHRIQYQFRVAGQTYSGTTVTHRATAVGDPFDVFHHPTNPQRHYLRSNLYGVRLTEED